MPAGGQSGVCCEEASPYQEGQDEEPTTNPNLTKETNLYYNQGDKKPAPPPPPPAVSGYAGSPAPTPRPGGYGQVQGQSAPQPTFAPQPPQPAPQPTYKPQPSYNNPQPAPQPSYNKPQPKPTPQPTYAPQPPSQPTYAPQPPTQPAPQPTYRPQTPQQPAPAQPSYYSPQPAPKPTYAPQPPTEPAPQPTYAPQPRPQPAPQPQPTYAPQPRPQPAPQPTYAPQQPPQPTYAPQPRPQPAPQPRPQPQPTYAPQPPPQPAPQPTYAPQQPPRPAYAPQPAPQPTPQPSYNPQPTVLPAPRPVPPQPQQPPQPSDDSEPASTQSPVYETPFNGPLPLPPYPGPPAPQPQAVQRTPQPQQPQQPQQEPEPTKPSYGPQDAEVCGERRQVPRPEGLPAGQAAPGEYPWQAIVASRADNNPICGAAVLSKDAVLTAAHCVHDKEASDLVVIAGEHRMGVAEPGAQQSGVAAIARHPDFNAASLHHDQAVLRLAEPLTLGDSVGTICLPDDDQSGGANLAAPTRPQADNCVATGWGLKALKGNHVGSSLNAIPARLMPTQEAERHLRRTFLGPNFQMHPSQVCALATQPDTNLCMVDPGGPLACPRPDGRLVLTGVYSWDVGCHPSMVSLPEGPMSPTAFSNVDAAWVRRVLAQPVQSLVQEERNEVLRKQQQEKQPEFEKPGFSQGYGK